jgi:acetoin utilization deacetylase AcuC-like enzyme
MKPTGLFEPAACALHEMGPGHPECPERLGAIHDRLLASGLLGLLQSVDSGPADPADLLLAHGRGLVDQLQEVGRELSSTAGAGQRRYCRLDPDTAMNPHSLDAALHATGAALAATDAVLAGTLANAFCAVRPPGHHACRNMAMGFCLVNNVAVAALHALQRHGLERVAIVDFDVHHGNGTEDIVAGDERILMVSFYQHPFYPAGGSRSDAPNLVNLPVPAYTGGAEVRKLVEQHWLPRLERHRPQMIFISAGFDAHREDDLGQMRLVEDDYRWITQQVKSVALRHGQGRIVSCLEGGYNLSALGRSVEAHLRALADL